jgi:CBS domain-containing protein
MYGHQSTVESVMTRRVVAVGEDAPFREVVETMARFQAAALPVLAGDGRVVGVVSEADLLPKEEFRARRLGVFDRERRGDALVKAEASTAGELMTAPAVCVPAGAPVSEAARIVALRGVRQLPVTGPTGRLVGMVARGDLLKVFLRPDEEIADEIRHEVVGTLFPEPGGAEPAGAGKADGKPAGVEAEVRDGRVVLRGTVGDADLVPVATRLAQAVEGVVDVRNELRPV